MNHYVYEVVTHAELFQLTEEEVERVVQMSAERDAQVDRLMSEKLAPPRPLFAFDPDEPARLRRVFAGWDFRNGT